MYRKFFNHLPTDQLFTLYLLCFKAKKTLTLIILIVIEINIKEKKDSQVVTKYNMTYISYKFLFLLMFCYYFAYLSKIIPKFLKINVYFNKNES